MKKKLEAELISIAHRILKLKNKSDIIQLHQETQKLYEKLSILRFVEENLGDVKPTIGRSQIEDLIESSFDEPAAENFPQQESASIEEVTIPHATEVIAELADEKEPDELVAEAEPEMEVADNESEPEPQAEPEIEQEENPDEDEVMEPEPEPAPAKAEENFAPAFEWSFERKDPEPESSTENLTEEISQPQSQDQRQEIKEALAQAEIAFEDLLGPGYVDPVFVKSDELQSQPNQTEEPLKDVIPISRGGDKVQVIKMNNSEIADRTVSLNDRLSKGITVGLNDRIAFVKHLFHNSNEDYNRVLSQLITFNTFDEAKEFIDNMVKPDYNNWEGKNEYADRFMEVVEKKFS